MMMHSLTVQDGWYRVTALVPTDDARREASVMCHALAQDNWRSQLVLPMIDHFSDLSVEYGQIWHVSFENSLHAILFKLRWGFC